MRELIRRASNLDTPYPDYGPVLDHFDAELEALHRGLSDAENAYDAAGPALAQLRCKRDELAASLRAVVAAIPRALRAHPGLDRAALPGAPPELPDALAKYLTDTLNFLRHLGRNPPLPACGIQPDTDVLAAELEPGLRELEACLDAIVKADVDVTSTRTQADQAFFRARDVSSWIGLVTENLTLLAGEEWLDGAARKRVVTPRRRL